MPKLSPALKELINAPFAHPGPTPAPMHIREIYQAIAAEAAERNYGRNPWLTLSAAATFTLNCPSALATLYQVATQAKLASQCHTPVAAAELIREVGLKCISFNGIPRTINCLSAFRAALPTDVVARLETRPTRQLDADNITVTNRRGRVLWDSIYTPLEEKLLDKLAESHPDLPVHILGSHYSPLLSDPAERGGLSKVGRSLTSVVAISCLRSQTGVGPQVLSHVLGLWKVVEQGLLEHEEALEDAKAVELLATNEGSEWLLKSVDTISYAIGLNFAQGHNAKL